eukprot:980970-Lingulodinium_polyedra.AAC.1
MDLGADKALIDQAAENWAVIGAWEMHEDYLLLRPWAAQGHRTHRRGRAGLAAPGSEAACARRAALPL